jgi:hypothetical protein
VTGGVTLRSPLALQAAVLGAALGPFLFVSALIYARGVGFYHFDDWNYVLAMEHLAQHDWRALFTSVCEHRPIAAKLGFYVTYRLGLDTTPLIYAGLLAKLVTVLLIVRGVREPGAGRSPLAPLDVLLAFVASVFVFSPVQAWAFARAVYAEIFLCALGAVAVVFGLSQRRWAWLALGLVVSLTSTPGWFALIPTLVAVMVLGAVSSGTARVEIRHVVLLGGLLALLAAYAARYDHPNELQLCGHPSITAAVGAAARAPLDFGGALLRFIGFPVAFVPSLGGLPVVQGLAGLLFVVFAVMRLVSVRGRMDFGATLLVWTLVVCLAITLTRHPVLPPSAFPVNFAYSGYVMPGWATAAVLAILWIRELGRADWLRRGLTVAVALVCAGGVTSYAAGTRVMLDTMSGIGYYRDLYREGIILGKSEPMEVARKLYAPWPEFVVRGTSALRTMGDFPRSWKEGER